MLIKKIAGITVAGALALTLAACGTSTGASSSSSSVTSTSAATSTPASTGMMSSGGMTSGAMSSGAKSSGAMTSGPMSSGAMSSGAMSSGAMSSGAMSSGAMSSGAMMSGSMSSSGMSSGAMSSGPMSSGAMSSGAMSSGAMAGQLVGSGCAAYAKANPAGAGSVSGMATDPVAVAASNNPLLKTLVAAVSGKLNPKVNLVQTLDSSEFTVFAPVDSAFAKIPAATLNSLKTDSATLTKILTYHVVAGQLAPSQIVGAHKTVEGGSVTVTGSGNNLKVNNASVVCGGVKTKNATVYLIDTVLMPTN